MPHVQPATLAELRAFYTPELYRTALLSCGNKRTDSATLAQIHSKFFMAGTDWSKTDMTTTDLSEIMALKLSRGKWRPRLQQLVESNASDLVTEITRNASDASLDVKDRMDELCRLKAVGPATASLILTILDENVPFYSDEFAAFHLGDGKLKYNMKEYLALLQVHEKWMKKEMDKKENKEIEVTARQVEEMIWLWSRGRNTKLGLASQKENPTAPNNERSAAALDPKGQKKPKT